MAFCTLWALPPGRLRRATSRREACCGRYPRAALDGAAEDNDASPNAARPFQVALDFLSSASDAAFDAIYSPVSSCTVLSRQWQSKGGNFILRPPVKRAHAVIHFIGGAFVGAAPHIAYRTFLERLASRGFCVVAAPYDLRTDYLAVTASIVDAWEKIESDLALDYGAIPIIGIGHSAGAVFHCLASSLFELACPKAANILISFNNKEASEAIPLYRQVFAPIIQQSLQLEHLVPRDVKKAIDSIPAVVEEAVEKNPLTPKRFRENVLPTLRESRRVVEQLWPLFRDIGRKTEPEDASESDPDEGAVPNASEQPKRDTSEFYPSPADIQASVETLYAPGKTLIIKFDSDIIDESDRLLDMIQKRGASTDVSMLSIAGTHITPLSQDFPGPLQASAAAAMQNLQTEASQRSPDGLFSLLSTVFQEGLSAFTTKDLAALETLISEWIQAGLANDEL